MKYKLDSNNYYELLFMDDKKRNLLLVIPGGAYIGTAKRESWEVAKAFSDQPYHQAIFFYREDKLLYPEINFEGGQVLKELKDHPLVDEIFVIGFSAGGHYAAMLATSYYDYIDKLVLCYPVITTDIEFSHKNSFENLLGGNCDEKSLEQVSIEKHIHPLFPPTFIMHTFSDELVSIENSLLLIKALTKNHIYQEAHFYPIGRHGVSVATAEVCFEDMSVKDFVNQYGYIHEWVNLAKKFLLRNEHI